MLNVECAAVNEQMSGREYQAALVQLAWTCEESFSPNIWKSLNTLQKTLERDRKRILYVCIWLFVYIRDDKSRSLDCFSSSC